MTKRDPEKVKEAVRKFFMTRATTRFNDVYDGHPVIYASLEVYPEGGKSFETTIYHNGEVVSEPTGDNVRLIFELHKHLEDTFKDTPTPGRKDDQGKPDYTLLTQKNALDRIVRVLEYGAKKYSPDNWRRVEGREKRYRSAAMRHLLADIQSPGSMDPETGESHLAHAACCLLFLLDEMEDSKE